MKQSSKISHNCRKLVVMPKIFTSKTQKMGELAENIVVRFLVKHDFYIVERNYTKPWGEIDIIAEKSNKLHFIEVKSASKNLQKTNFEKTKGEEEYKPEYNMHALKMKRMARTVQAYLSLKNINQQIDWQVDLFWVHIDIEHKKTKMGVVKDIIL